MDAIARRHGITLVSTLVVVQTVVHLANRWTARHPAWDVNEERTVFSLLAAAVIGAAALGLVGVAARGTAGRGTPLVLAGLLAFLALDEWAAVHERIGVRGADLLGLSNSWDSVVWPVLYLPLVGTVFLLFLRLAARLSPAERRLVHRGLVLLVAAVALEVVSAPFSTPTTADGLVHALEGAVEEAGELLGWGLLAVAALTSGRGRHRGTGARRQAPLRVHTGALAPAPLEERT